MHKGFYTTFLCILFATVVTSLKGQNLAVTNIINPTTALNCAGVPRQDSVTVRVSNLGTAAITNFNISYSLNGGGAVTETYTGTPLAASTGFVNYTFATKLNTTSGGVNTLKVYTSLVGDINRANDTLALVYVPKITAFPYYENFEANNGGFTAGGTNSTWVWGARNKPNTGKAGDGVNAWTNGGLTGLYANSDNSFLRSPCYDFTNLKNPYIAFKFVAEVEYSWETVTLQYSTNGGASWAAVGSSADADNCETKNWFNSGGWTGNSHSYPCSSWGSGCGGRGYCGGWAEGRHCIAFLAGQPNVMFQWAFTSSGTQCTGEGFAVDSLVMGEAPVLAPFSVAAPDSVCQNAGAFFTPTLSSCYKNPRWDFGDSSAILRIQNVAHGFRTPGQHTVKLMVDGLCGKVDTLYKTIYVKPAPATSITTFGKALCKSGSTVSLSATPTGGTFYVDGTPQTTIDPAALSLGQHYAMYEYKAPGPNSCTARDTAFFKVYVPTATIDNLGGQYCPAAPSFKLKATPAGGIFSVDGVQDSMFRPGTLALGTHTVIYAYTDSIGCPASDTKSTDIQNSLTVTLNGLNSFYCAGDAPVTLSGTPTGGVFYINGAVATKYDPALLAPKAGKDTVVYYYTDGACFNSDTLTLDAIKNNPAISSINPIYCNDAAVVTLNATPAGGIFTLDSKPVFSINPKTTTPGAHRLTYTYQDPTHGCLDSAVKNVTIDKPTAKINNLLPNYCIDATAVNLAGTPTGGSFTVNSGTSTQFTPGALGVGTHRVIYAYTDVNNCTAKDTLNVKVVGLPALQFNGFVKNLCFNSNPVPINTNPTGGAFSIDGLPVNSGTFDPSLYKAGSFHTIQYTFVDFTYGCVNSIKDSIFIGTPPAVSFSGLNTQYCSSDDSIHLSGVPTGGQFMVNGAPATSFSPKTLGAGSYTVKYKYTDANGCTNEIDQVVDVITNPGDTIYPGPVINICQGNEVTLNVNGLLPGVWSTNQTTNSITVHPAVNTTYWYKVNDCASYYDSVDVLVHNNPKADFDFEPKEGFIPLDITAKNKSTGISSFKWITEGKESTDDPMKHSFTTPGKFTVKLAVVNDNGCVDTLEQTVTVYDGLSIPNVFSPNGDDVNDKFGPITNGTFSKYNFKIFNRWGNLMFEGSRPQDRWDGTENGNPAAEGTYFYILVAENLKEFKLEGTVTLVR